MKIGINALRNKYGIDLPVGKFSVVVEGGNYRVSSVKDDTEGCILVGRDILNDNYITDSRNTLLGLMTRLEEVYERGDKIVLEVK